MLTSAPARNRFDVAATIGGLLGLALLVFGSLWPWLTGPTRILGLPPSPVLLWVAVAAAAVMFAGAMLRLPAAVAWVALGVLVAASLIARATTEPSWMCWDGFDEDGNMVGGCEEDQWTFAPVVFAAGALLIALASVRALLAAPVRRPG